MGYNTLYNLEFEPYNKTPKSECCGRRFKKGEKFCPHCGEGRTTDRNDVWGFLELHENEYYGIWAGEHGEATKWYEYNERMTELSKTFPGILFELHGEGEESDDIWVAYYLDGKSYLERARIVFDEFDKERLK